MQRNVNTWSIQVMGIWVFIVYSVTLTVFFILNFFQNTAVRKNYFKVIFKPPNPEIHFKANRLQCTKV